MSFTSHLPPRIERLYRELAAAQGVSVDALLLNAVISSIPAAYDSVMMPEDSEEWIREFRSWRESHAGLPLLSDETISRESIYADRGLYMTALVDTNIILRSLSPEHPHHTVAKNAIESLRRRDTLRIASQNLIEFSAFATRPRSANGLWLSQAEAAGEIEKLRWLFRLLPPGIEVVDHWQRLVLDLGVTGKQAHDAHLVAAMAVRGVDGILTFNVEDFTRYPDISVIDPFRI